jgi:hypothetical protein
MFRKRLNVSYSEQPAFVVDDAIEKSPESPKVDTGSRWANWWIRFFW